METFSGLSMHFKPCVPHFTLLGNLTLFFLQNTCHCLICLFILLCPSSTKMFPIYIPQNFSFVLAYAIFFLLIASSSKNKINCLLSLKTFSDFFTWKSCFFLCLHVHFLRNLCSFSLYIHDVCDLVPLGYKFLEVIGCVSFISVLACRKALIMANALIMDVDRLVYSNNSVITLPFKLKGLIRRKAPQGQGALPAFCTAVSPAPRVMPGTY